MKIFAIPLVLISLWGFGSAVRDVFFGGVPRPEPPERFVAFVIGSFAIPLVPLLLGIWFWRNGRSFPPDEASADVAASEDAPIERQ